MGYFVYRYTKLATCNNGVTQESKTGIPVERMSISGLNLDDIPCLLPRKQWKHGSTAHFLPCVVFSDCASLIPRKRKRDPIEWTEEQDQTLLKTVAKIGGKWSRIQKENAVLPAVRIGK